MQLNVLNQTTSNPGRRAAAGFTLIELMVALAVLGIIMAVAIPSYRQYALESGRADGKALLYQAAQTLERCYTRYSAYNDGACALQQGDTVESENEKYELTVTAATANDYTLTAAPQGGQADDTECGSLTLTANGTKGAAGGTDAAVVEECW
jgi:type IV pilus assembly protein PilE